jgi:two-component system nitrogen regulation response regulator GlnG
MRAPKAMNNGHDIESASRADCARWVADAVAVIVERLKTCASNDVYRHTRSLVERALLIHALTVTGGNQLRAARVLGLNRKTLYKRCRALHVPLHEFRGARARQNRA